jgi:hypothetical protein
MVHQGIEEIAKAVPNLTAGALSFFSDSPTRFGVWFRDYSASM